MENKCKVISLFFVLWVWVFQPFSVSKTSLLCSAHQITLFYYVKYCQSLESKVKTIKLINLRKLSLNNLHNPRSGHALLLFLAHDSGNSLPVNQGHITPLRMLDCTGSQDPQGERQSHVMTSKLFTLLPSPCFHYSFLLLFLAYLGITSTVVCCSRCPAQPLAPASASLDSPLSSYDCSDVTFMVNCLCPPLSTVFSVCLPVPKISQKPYYYWKDLNDVSLCISPIIWKLHGGRFLYLLCLLPYYSILKIFTEIESF